MSPRPDYSARSLQGRESCLVLSVARAKRAIWRIRLLRVLRGRAARLVEGKP